MEKKLKDYGYNALDRLDKKSEEFCNGEIDLPTAKGIAIMSNSTSRAMDSTLRVEKYNTALSIATK